MFHQQHGCVAHRHCNQLTVSMNRYAPAKMWMPCGGYMLLDGALVISLNLYVHTHLDKMCSSLFSSESLMVLLLHHLPFDTRRNLVQSDSIGGKHQHGRSRFSECHLLRSAWQLQPRCQPAENSVRFHNSAISAHSFRLQQPLSRGFPLRAHSAECGGQSD